MFKKLGDEGCEQLATMIETAPEKVKGLDAMYHDLGITAAGIARLAKALEKCSNLTTVFIMDSPEMGPEGGKTIANLIKDGPTSIGAVGVPGCSIGDEGAVLIAEAIKSTDKVIELTLSNNGISDEGLKAITEMLERSRISEANLGENAFTKEGMALLGAMFKTNTTIEQLAINDIRAEGAISTFASAGIADNATCTSL